MLDREAALPLRRIEPRPASREEIETVHAHEYFGYMASTAGKDYVVLDPDTAATARTFATALLASGGVIEAADAVLEGEVGNAFALVRPPGHHAESNQAKGFCIFNSIAVAAEHLLKTRGLKRILIADWDLHHGNGTQHSFYARRDVLFFSPPINIHSIPEPDIGTKSARARARVSRSTFLCARVKPTGIIASSIATCSARSPRPTSPGSSLSRRVSISTEEIRWEACA